MNPLILNILRERCSTVPISYRDFIELALYHPKVGYYSTNRSRVGPSRNNDFYTAESLGTVFSQLVIDSARTLLNTEDLSPYHFVEIGAEPNHSLLDSLPTKPFKQYSVLRPGDSLSTKGEPCIIFANEWLDALPFHRLRYQDNAWRERAVYLNDAGVLEERLLDSLSPALLNLAKSLPDKSSEGYEIDLSSDVEIHINQLMEEDWNGLLLFFDYGKTWRELTQAMPNGSARTYAHHQQGSDLFHAVGDSDITFDICWDCVQNVLKTKHKLDSDLKSQEAFFVHYAPKTIKRILSESKFSISHEKATLLELIHPTNMGQKFQVLHALRK